MEKKERIPAPIDNKNVTTDWIEEIFDYQTCIWGERRCAIGFIHEQPVLAAWSGNLLIWKFTEEKSIVDSDHLAVLKDRLKQHHDPNGSLEETFRVSGNLLMQQFHWKNEDYDYERTF